MEKYFPFTPFAGKRIHLGVTGSVAAYKALDFLRACVKIGLRVNVTLTASAQRFVSALSFRSLGADAVYTSMFCADHALVAEQFDPFPHLTPMAEAESLVILPASATSMARIAQGLADEILSAQALAFLRTIIFAPAMNPRMWKNSATKANCQTLRSMGHLVLEPDEGLVACKEEGKGKLTDLRAIYLTMLSLLAPQDLAGKKILITLGPTREAWDGVRYWTNPSTGLMGASFAIASMLRGAEVDAVCGPGCPWLPPQIRRYDVGSAKEMLESCSRLWDSMDIGVFTAAVADFSPEPFGAEKFKKDSRTTNLEIKFTPNPDILATLAARKKPEQKIIGFAAETSNLEKNTLDKLKRKNADILIGNVVGKKECAFGSSSNRVFIADKTGNADHWNTLPKPDIAWKVLDWLLRL